MKKVKWLLSVLVSCMMVLGLIPVALAEPASPIDITVTGYGIGQSMADAGISTASDGITVTPIGNWQDSKYNDVTGSFERGKLYCHYVRLKAKDGGALPTITDDNIKSIITINGKAPQTAWAWDPEADGSQKILFFMEILSEDVDSLSLTVNNLVAGNTWAESNVTTNSEQVFVQNAKLIYKGISGNHDVLVTEALEPHTPYQLYLYVWTNNGSSFDVDTLAKEDVSVEVNGQVVHPVAIRDGGDNGRSIVMDVDMPALHRYGAYLFDGDSHWMECQDVDCPDKESSIQDTKAPHGFGAWSEVKAPTETVAGLKERVCSVCNYKESAPVPPTGHGETEIRNAKTATCTEEGYTGDTVCKNCGEVLERGKVIAKLMHQFEEGKCILCGAADPNVKPDESTPAPTLTPEPTPEITPTTDKPEAESPKTGDGSSVMLWGMAFLASGLGIVILCAFSKRKAAKRS